MKKILLFLLYSIAPFSNLMAQSYVLYGDKTFGTYSHDDNSSTILINNKYLILAGSTNININGDKTDPKCDSTNQLAPDNWLLKIDTAFNIIWNKSIGGARGEQTPTLLYLASSNQIVIACNSTSDSSCEKTANNKAFPGHTSNYWLSTIDTNGNQVNDKTWGGTSGGELFGKIVQLNSGNYIIYGLSQSPVGGDKTVPNYNPLSYDYWVIKTDSLGNKLWDKVYGGTGNEIGMSLFPYNANNFMVLPENYDNFILAGCTNSQASGDISDSSRGDNDIWLIKVDSTGNKIWDKRYGGSGGDVFTHIIDIENGGYMICGATASPQGEDVTDTSKGLTDCWIIKLDSLGNKIWDKRYGGSGNDQASWIEKAPGGGYWISGTILSDSSSDITEHPYGTFDYWIFKIDSNGNKLWDKRFGGPGINSNHGFLIMPDSSIFLYGSADTGTSAVKTDSGRGLEDFWLVHFKYTDPVSPVGINDIVNFNNSISLYPNPTKDIITIKSTTEKIKRIELFNIVGEIIYTQKENDSHTAQVNLQMQPSGFYFVKITEERSTVTKRIIKE